MFPLAKASLHPKLYFESFSVQPQCPSVIQVANFLFFPGFLTQQAERSTKQHELSFVKFRAMRVDRSFWLRLCCAVSL